MRRTLFAVLLALHGGIHLLGPIEFWNIANIDGIAPPDASDTVVTALGALWLIAALGFIAGAAMLWRGDRLWRPLALASAVLSFVIAGVIWQDAWAGMLIDVVIALAALPGRIRTEAEAPVPEDGPAARSHVLDWRPFGGRGASRS